MTQGPSTLAFRVFWDWLVGHPNCVLRAGSADSVLYDDEDYHWHFATEGQGSSLVQVIRGKRLVAELWIPNDEIAYVQAGVGEQEGEFVFELITESPSEHSVAFFFVLSHGYEEPGLESSGRVH